MTNYSDNPGMVRVDFFKPRGKWYMTEAHDMSEEWYTGTPADALAKVLSASRPESPDFWRHFTVVCLEPYHRFEYPVMIVASA